MVQALCAGKRAPMTTPVATHRSGQQSGRMVVACVWLGHSEDPQSAFYEQADRGWKSLCHGVISRRRRCSANKACQPALLLLPTISLVLVGTVAIGSVAITLAADHAGLLDRGGH